MFISHKCHIVVGATIFNWTLQTHDFVGTDSCRLKNNVMKPATVPRIELKTSLQLVIGGFISSRMTSNPGTKTRQNWKEFLARLYLILTKSPMSDDSNIFSCRLLSTQARYVYPFRSPNMLCDVWHKAASSGATKTMTLRETSRTREGKGCQLTQGQTRIGVNIYYVRNESKKLRMNLSGS